MVFQSTYTCIGISKTEIAVLYGSRIIHWSIHMMMMMMMMMTMTSPIMCAEGQYLHDVSSCGQTELWQHGMIVHIQHRYESQKRRGLSLLPLVFSVGYSLLFIIDCTLCYTARHSLRFAAAVCLVSQSSGSMLKLRSEETLSVSL